MSRQSAGILLYRRASDSVEALLAHPGGPFWAKKDSWSIPKGELDEGEAGIEAALREFEEEIGMKIGADDKLIDLGSAKQSNKTIFIWAVEGDFDVRNFSGGNTFTMEWPPKSGNNQEFPENDKAAWFALAVAKQKVFKAQAVFLDRLADHLKIKTVPEPGQQTLL